MLRRTAFLPLCLALTALALLCCPAEAAAGARDGLALCAGTVLPALFPFLVLSGLVVELGCGAWLGRHMGWLMAPLFGLSGRGASALVLGLVGGYPLGARTVGELYRRGELPRWEAERLLLFCNNAGPAFLLSVVGVQLFGSPRAGWLLVGTHAVGAILCGVLARLHTGGRRESVPPSVAPPPSFSTAFSAAIGSAVGAALNICACVVLFGVFLRLLRLFGVLKLGTALLTRLGVPGDCAGAVLSGALEMTNGVAALPHSPTAAALTAAAFLLGFGGLSVFCQTASLLAGSGLSPVWCLKGQLVHGAVSALLTAAVLAVWPGAVTAFFAPVSPLADPVCSALPTLMGLAGWGCVAGLGLWWSGWRRARPLR